MSVANHGGEEQNGGSGDMDDGDPRAAIDACDPGLIANPLDFLLNEHLRQRQFAKILTLIADGVINRRTVRGVIDFITNDLAQHILDEEISLFPVLRPLCEQDDKIDAILGVLADEHREDESTSDDVLAILRKIEKGEKTSLSDRATLRNFAEHLRHHIALENGVLLPIARARMTADALRIVEQSLKSRRSRKRI
jgi:hemerythrin-like domain-containing protein